MQPNEKPSPNINYFRSHALKIKKTPHFISLNCPSHLNIKHAHANEYEETADGAKSRQSQCKRCNKIA